MFNLERCSPIMGEFTVLAVVRSYLSYHYVAFTCAISTCFFSFSQITNFSASGHILIYVIPSVAFVVLVILGCCVYCLCCRKRRQRSLDRDDRKLQRRREEIKQRYAERRAERKMKTDAIRQKYGLLSNEDAEVA